MQTRAGTEAGGDGAAGSVAYAVGDFFALRVELQKKRGGNAGAGALDRSRGRAAGEGESTEAAFASTE